MNTSNLKIGRSKFEPENIFPDFQCLTVHQICIEIVVRIIYSVMKFRSQLLSSQNFYRFLRPHSSLSYLKKAAETRHNTRRSTDYTRYGCAPEAFNSLWKEELKAFWHILLTSMVAVAPSPERLILVVGIWIVFLSLWMSITGDSMSLFPKELQKNDSGSEGFWVPVPKHMQTHYA